MMICVMICVDTERYLEEGDDPDGGTVVLAVGEDQAYDMHHRAK